MSRNLYFSKGFRAPQTEPVGVVETVETKGLKCPLCEFSCDAPRGLAKHMYSHDKKNKEET